MGARFGFLERYKHGASRPCISAIRRLLLAVYRGIRPGLGCSNLVSRETKSGSVMAKLSNGSATIPRSPAARSARSNTSRAGGSRERPGESRGTGGRNDPRLQQATARLAAAEEKYRLACEAEDHSRRLLDQEIAHTDAPQKKRVGAGVG